jgi:O-antigen ligase
MWSYALQLFAQRPILGWSGDVATAKLAEHLQAFNVPASIPHVFENDLLHYAAVSGLLGVTSVLALYAGIFIGFWKFEKQSTLQTRSAFALMGMLLVVLIFEFSLTCNVLGRSSFRYFFCEFTVILLGLMIMSAKEDASSTWHGFILKLKQP